MKQHCVVNHQALWQGDGKPLRSWQGDGKPLQSFSAEQSFFAKLHKQRLSTRQAMNKEAQQTRLSPQSKAEASGQPLQEFPTNVSASAEATRALDAEHMNNDKQSLADRLLTCPNCEYSTTKFGRMRQHCVNYHNRVWRGQGLPLRAPHDGEILSCPNCDYRTIKLTAMQRHCFQQHRLVWEGNELPLRTPVSGEEWRIKCAQVQDDILACPNCEYVTSNLGDIKLHCLRRHALEWQGKGLPLRQPDNVVVEKPAVVDEIFTCPECKYVTSNPVDVNRHCIHHHGLEWQHLRQNQLKRILQRNVTLQQFLSNLDINSLIQENEISSESCVSVNKTDEKSYKLEDADHYGKIRPDASASSQLPSTATLITSNDADDIDVEEATFSSSGPQPEQFPSVFLASAASHSPVPETLANSAPVQPPEEFPRRSPIHDVDYRYSSFDRAAAENSAAVEPPGEFPGRSPPRDVDYRYLSFDQAAAEGDGVSATDQLCFYPTSAPGDDNTAAVSDVQDVTVAQAAESDVDIR